MTAKPTLGYASRTEAVVGLRAQGVPTREIARKLGIAIKTVSALERSGARKAGVRVAEPRGLTTEGGQAVVVSLDALRALRPHAAKRNLSVNALVRRLIDTVADEGMVDAVLDDGGRP